jgi:hypothetical protein
MFGLRESVPGVPLRHEGAKHGRLFCPTSQVCFAKIFPFPKERNYDLTKLSRARQRGASRSSRNVARDAMDADAPQDVRRGSRTVKPCGSGSPMLESSLRDAFRRRWWLTSPVHQEERGAAVKPLRRECRMFRPACTDLWAPFLFSPQGLRVRLAPGIPCALCFPEGHRMARLGREIAPRECEVVADRGIGRGCDDVLE